MNNEEKAQRIVCFHCNQQYCKGLQTIKSCPKNKEVNSLLEMSRWKDEQYKEQLSNLKDEIQSNLCASSGFNDEYSRGYQDCGMKVMEMIDKILEL